MHHRASVGDRHGWTVGFDVAVGAQRLRCGKIDHAWAWAKAGLQMGKAAAARQANRQVHNMVAVEYFVSNAQVAAIVGVCVGDVDAGAGTPRHKISRMAGLQFVVLVACDVPEPPLGEIRRKDQMGLMCHPGRIADATRVG